jgi:hypothetical protein
MKHWHISIVCDARKYFHFDSITAAREAVVDLERRYFELYKEPVNAHICWTVVECHDVCG